MSSAPRAALDYHALYRRYRVQTFALTWLAYAAYYLCRTNYSIVKKTVADAHALDAIEVGWIDTTYLALYALGQFCNGVVGDRIGGKLLVGLGLLATGCLNLLFGAGSSFAVFFLAYGLNGWAQSAGWPGSAKAFSQWFAVEERGTAMGFWCTCYQAGSVASTFLATWLLVHYGWRAAWFAPALIALGFGALFLSLQKRSPQEEGLPDVETYYRERVGAPAPAPSGAESAEDEGPEPFSVLRSRPIWTLGLTYVFLKFMRYAFLFWLPFYMAGALGYQAGEAGYTSVVFDLSGVAGAVFAGVISDRVFKGRRAPIVVAMMAALAVAVYFYGPVSRMGRVPNIAAIAVIGFLIYGPDAIASGAATVDFGSKRAAAAAAGFVNGLGSVGAAFSGVAIGYLSSRFGWAAVFHVFAPLAVIGAALMATMWNARPRT